MYVAAQCRNYIPHVAGEHDAMTATPPPGRSTGDHAHSDSAVAEAQRRRQLLVAVDNDPLLRGEFVVVVPAPVVAVSVDEAGQEMLPHSDGVAEERARNVLVVQQTVAAQHAVGDGADGVLEEPRPPASRGHLVKRLRDGLIEQRRIHEEASDDLMMAETMARWRATLRDPRARGDSVRQPHA